MGRLKIGLAVGAVESPTTGVAPGWDAVRSVVGLAEDVGFDTVWIADELVWESPEGQHDMGWWECVAMLGAVAASTSTISIGSWVLSALHRGPGVTVRAVETIDEISSGRFIFGFGSGHAGRQGEAFGFPPDYTVSRYEEALAIVMPLIREGTVDFTGSYHSAVRQPNHPRGPQQASIPVLLGGHGPRTIGLAVDYADIWSAYATKSSHAAAFENMMALVDAACVERDRDPETLGRSVGIAVQRTDAAPPAVEPFAPPVAGTVDEIVSELVAFADLGFTSVELLGGWDTDDVERLAPIVEAARSI